MMKRILWIIGGVGMLLLIFYIGHLESMRASVRSSFNPASDLSELPLAYGRQRQARIQRGDTSVLNQKELADLLPTTLVAYHAQGEPNSSLVNLMGNRYTVAEQLYRKGKQQLKVSIADYNAAYTLYNVATATVAAGITMDTEEQQVQELNLGMKEVKGWEMFDKREQKAVVTLGVADRFLITIEATEAQDAASITRIVENLELDHLN